MQETWVSVWRIESTEKKEILQEPPAYISLMYICSLFTAYKSNNNVYKKAILMYSTWMHTCEIQQERVILWHALEFKQ